jgi:hypothetical protein
LGYPFLMVAVSSLVAGCSILEDEVARGYAQRESLTPATFTTADVRVITQRNRQGSPGPIICTEPSPDVAKALSAAAAANAQGGNAGTTGSFGAGGASAEAVLALAGRSTALLGLRDGLYRACEAYANGALGADAYALVLSRYGQLMTTLFLGQDVTGAAGTAAGGSVQSPPVSVTINPSGASAVTAGAQSPPPATQQLPGTQTASSTDNSSVAPLALARMNEDYLNLGYNPNTLIIACINYQDPTRVSTPVREGARPGNPYLDEICPNLFKLDTLSGLAIAAENLVKNHVLAPPVNPAAVATKTTQSNAATKPGTAPSSKLTTEQIKAAQTKLQAFCTNLKVDGKLGPLTTACVKEYQSNNKLTPSGDLDADTLKALGVK